MTVPPLVLAIWLAGALATGALLQRYGGTRWLGDQLRWMTIPLGRLVWERLVIPLAVWRFRRELEDWEREMTMTDEGGRDD